MRILFRRDEQADAPHVFGDVDICCERIKNLLEDGLLATRRGGLLPQRASLSVGSVLKAAAEQVRKVAEAKLICVHVALEQDRVAVLDRALITRGLVRLLTRVISESEAGTDLELSCQLESDEITIALVAVESLAVARVAGARTTFVADGAGRSNHDGDRDLEFCHFVAESHGGHLSGGGGTLFRMVFPQGRNR